MRVRITKHNGYGDRYGVEHALGDEVEFPDALAQKLVANRIAVPVPAKSKAPAEVVVETAASAPPQNAAKRTGKAQPRKKA